jgi:3-hydroxyacyl-CoA dehydrogenase/enoyl-CoA hydratase/carnithine racemase
MVYEPAVAAPGQSVVSFGQNHAINRFLGTQQATEGPQQATMIQYHVQDGICILRLGPPPLRTIGFSLLEGLRAAIRRAALDGGVRGIVITGDSGHFSAGADIGIFKKIHSAEDAVSTSRIFQEAFGQVEDSPKPVVAAVAGRVMGSALELAMACRFRVAGRTSAFSMPEVNLGINPGAGGTQRLPRLVGAETALRMLLSAAAIDAQEALACGLVDAVCESEALVETARSLLQSAAPARRTRDRNEKVQDTAVNRAAFEKAQRLADQVRAEIIAPRKIIEAVQVGLEESFQAGLRKEQEAFADCMGTPAARNKIYLFFATRQTGKIPGLAGMRPAKVTKAAVVGMGSMGTGIVEALMLAGVPVAVRDEHDSALAKGMAKIRASLQRRVDQGKLPAKRPEEMLSLISATTGWQEIADAELVIEAVFEDVQVKRSVIGRLEEVCAAGTIIATNTSTISLDVLAEGMRGGGRLIGIHFFHPAHRMPLVEIIPRETTPEGVVAMAWELAKRIGKTPVLVKNREGFLVNRLLIPYLKEAFWLLEEGADPTAIDSAMVEFGFPMGPLTLIDMAGLDILTSADRVLSRAFPRHGRLSPIAAGLVEEGHLGQKTGSGVYRYEAGDYTPRPSQTTQRIIARVQREAGRTPREMGAGEITPRLLLRMVGEAFYVLEEGVARSESDLDVAMVLGTGFPDFRGGVMTYARQLGLDNVLIQLQKLAAEFGERFAPCKLLREIS